MTLPVVGQTSVSRSRPYISPQMFAGHARRGIPVNNLVPGGDETAQLAALADYINQASAIMDSFLLGTLASTIDTEVGPVNIRPDGMAVIVPRNRPVIALTAFALGSIGNLTEYTDLSAASVEPSRILVPIGPWGIWNTNQGPLQFGLRLPLRGEAYGRWTTCNGYPVTQLTAPVAAIDTTISVADTTGIIAGQTPLAIQADRLRLVRTPTAVSTAGATGFGTGPGVLTFADPVGLAIGNDANFPTFVEALPDDVIFACVLMTRSLIKKSGGGNVQATSQTTKTKDPMGSGDDMASAYELIDQYQMVQR